MLAEEPDREIVVGAYTQPWHEQVTFHPLPPEQFAGFNQPGREPEWNPRTRSIKQLTDGPIGLGTRFQGEWIRGDPMTIEFVAFQRPTAWASVGRSRRLVANSDGQVSKTPSGIRLTIRMELQPQGALRFLMPVLGIVMRRREQRNLRAIKAALER